MAAETTTIEGKVLSPSAGPTTGRIEVRLIEPGGSTDDAGTEQVIGPAETFLIGTDGAVDFALVPNDAISPAGSFYSFHYRILTPSRADFTKHYSIATAPDPIDIGNLVEV